MWLRAAVSQKLTSPERPAVCDFWKGVFLNCMEQQERQNDSCDLERRASWRFWRALQAWVARWEARERWGIEWTLLSIVCYNGTRSFQGGVDIHCLNQR